MSKAEVVTHDHTDGTRVTMTARPVGVPDPEFAETLKVCAYGRWGTRKTLQIASLIREFRKRIPDPLAL